MAFSIPVIIGSDGNFSEATSSSPMWFPGGITNDATGDVALKVNVLPFTTANIAEFSLNGSLKASIDHTGLLTTIGINVGSSWAAVTFPGTAANQFFGGPTTGANATPSPRALVAADIPTTLSNLTITGINSASNLSIAGGSTSGNITLGGNITMSGVMTITGSLVFPTVSANQHFLGPATGSPASPGFRSQVAADLPGGNWMTANASEVVLSGTVNITSDSLPHDVGLSITLPAAGTYLVYYMCRGDLQNQFGTNGTFSALLFNTTDSANVANSSCTVFINNVINLLERGTATAITILTVTASKVIDLQATFNVSGAGAATIATVSTTAGGTTKLGYVRLV